MSAEYCLDCFEMTSDCECKHPSGLTVFGEHRLQELINRGLEPREKEEEGVEDDKEDWDKYLIKNPPLNID
jgi:hypothetical protein